VKGEGKQGAKRSPDERSKNLSKQRMGLGTRLGTPNPAGKDLTGRGFRPPEPGRLLIKLSGGGGRGYGAEQFK